MFKTLIMTIGLVSIMLLAQPAEAGEFRSVISAAPSTTSVTPNQKAWLNASVSERVKIAEKIGESGARKLAMSKGWTSIFDGTGGALSQGPDQIYRAADGVVHVVEAKGGTSPLSNAYGHRQGTSEWAVESSKRIVSSSKATASEKASAQLVLKAASEGRLQVHVVRTKHVLGEATVALLEKTSSTSDEAAVIARKSLEQVKVRPAKAVATTAAESVKNVASSADDVAKNAKMLNGLSKAAPVIGAAIDVGNRIDVGMKVENQYAAGQISEQKREIEHGKNAAGLIGGWGGAAAGTQGGAMIGAAVGGPFGAAAGAVTGGISGYIVGEEAAEAAAELAIDTVHSAGTTISGTASTVASSIGGAFSYVFGY